MIKNRFMLLILSAALVLLNACDSGSSAGSGAATTTTVTGVVLPSEMSVVTSSSDANVSGILINYASVSGVLTSQSFDSSSDYASDETNTYVFDESMEGVGTVNMLLCLIDQTGASKMVNKGAYVALVDEDKCEQGSNQSSAGSTGQSSGGNAKEYNRWVVNSTRASNDVPMIVNAWVSGIEGPGEQGMNIIVEIEAREGISADKPFGDFTMNFRGVNADDNTTIAMEGTLKTVFDEENNLKFSYINLGGDSAPNGAGGSGSDFTEKAFVVLDDAAGDSGVARLSKSFSSDSGPNGAFSETEEFQVAFDASYLLRKEADIENEPPHTPVCLDRSSFSTHVWRYNLYHRDAGTFADRAVTAGQRVSLNSGFPIRYSSGDNSYDGYISYWGVWLDGGQKLTDGASIEKMTYNEEQSTAEAYTVNISKGRLMRRTASTVGLNKLLGQKLLYWGPIATDSNNPEASTFGEWSVEVDSETYAFKVIGSVEFGQNGPTITNLQTPIDITPSQQGQNLNLWSDSLGGSINYTHDTQVAAANRSLTFYGEELVYPGDSTLFANGTSVTVYCYERCLKGGITQTNVDAANGEDDMYHPNASTAYTYTLTSVGGKMVLTDHLDAVVDFTVVNMNTIGHDWGINTGEMVTSLDGIENPWDVFNAATSYRWESGRNDWNQLVTVTDSNSVIATFDKPIQFTYTLDSTDEANADTSRVGEVFRLEYGGNGDLWGFPWEAKSDCDFETENCRWYPAATLKSGVELVDANNNVFVVKQIEREQTFNEVALSSCTSPHTGSPEGLNSDGASALVLPANIDAAVINTWADKPSPVSDAPAVIEGALQATDS